MSDFTTIPEDLDQFLPVLKSMNPKLYDDICKGNAQVTVERVCPNFGEGQHRHYKRLGRELAVQYLVQCDTRDSFYEQGTLEAFWEQAENSGKFPTGRVFRRGREFAERIIGIVLSDDQEITDLLEKYSITWDVSRMSVVDRNIMKVAIAEMRSMDDIPLIVSIDEAIEISKYYSEVSAGVFINGILNGVKNELRKPQK